MDRGSDKHAPRLDEQLDRETRGLTQGAGVGGRADESREPEPSGEDQPLVSLEPDADAPKSDIAEDTLGAISPAERDDRAAVATYLRRSVFPAKRSQLIREAEANNAPDHVLDELRRLDDDAEYATVADAWAAATGLPAHERRF
jgi:hypothetical protein